MNCKILHWEISDINRQYFLSHKVCLQAVLVNSQNFLIVLVFFARRTILRFERN